MPATDDEARGVAADTPVAVPVVADVAAAEPLGPPMGYGSCATMRVEGEAAPRGRADHLAVRAGKLGTWPAPCAEVDGWAGVSIALEAIDWAFSADGKRFLFCNSACRVVATASGEMLQRIVAGDAGGERPIFESPALAPLVKDGAFTRREGRWRHPDVEVTWTVSPDGNVVRYALRERATGVEVPLARFSGRDRLSPEKVEVDGGEVPLGSLAAVLVEPPVLAPDGRTLALLTKAQLSQELFAFMALAPVGESLAKLYRAAAKRDRAHADAFEAQAVAALAEAGDPEAELPTSVWAQRVEAALAAERARVGATLAGLDARLVGADDATRAALDAAVVHAEDAEVIVDGTRFAVTVPGVARARAALDAATPPDPGGAPRGFVSIATDARGLGRPLWVGATEVTRGAWTAVMGGAPRAVAGCEDAACPVVGVSFWSALAYLNARSKAERLPACYAELVGCEGAAKLGELACESVRLVDGCLGYRLPTEAEWELAAGPSAPSDGASAELDRVAWHAGTSDGLPHKVRRKAANDRGLHDALGNAAEWCWVPQPPTGPGGATGTPSAVRGGSFSDDAETVRGSARHALAPAPGYDDVGLRAARTAP